jgi:hypothetical protein
MAEAFGLTETTPKNQRSGDIGPLFVLVVAFCSNPRYSVALLSLSVTINSIQDIMRKDVGVDGDTQRLSQLAWLLFLKIFDAQETELDATRDDYRSPLPQKLRWRNWASDAEGMTGDGLMKFINDDLFPGLKWRAARIVFPKGASSCAFV